MRHADSKSARASSKVAAVPPVHSPGRAARIEAAAPLSFGSSAGVADACGDRADDHVTIVDAPSLLGDVGIDAAGEGGHGPILAPIGPKVKPPWVGGQPTKARDWLCRL